MCFVLMQIIYANRPGPACPGPGPLKSSHVTAAHYLSVSFDLPAEPGEQGRVGADSCGSQANPASPRSVTLGSPSRLTGKAAVACSSYFFVCVHVYLFLDLFK